jgi:hypothetical protein
MNVDVIALRAELHLTKLESSLSDFPHNHNVNQESGRIAEYVGQQVLFPLNRLTRLQEGREQRIRS